jgi:hypothetical protein
MGRLLKIAAFLLYVWIAAVGALGRVRAAKRARRQLDASSSSH